MNNNREMLELAAKAAGLKQIDYWSSGHHPPFPDAECIIHYIDGEPCFQVWNPLTDDGDCARMEAFIQAKIDLSTEYASCISKSFDPLECDSTRSFELVDNHGGDPDKARRWASTQCAAKVGKMLKERGL